MNDTETIVWDLIGWEGDDVEAHVTCLTRVEIESVKDLFPERRDDDLLQAAVYPVPPALYPAMRSALPRLEFREGLEYQVGGYRLSV
ncbi:hypothetical protein ABZX85_20800 [Streptomyces sp. NPDC004539]|uniref:hypothetical protein n=1 Tax=Streptomyces sp. NPDC004539 TaxID=3154280 RepID=UPI0033A098B7